MNTVSGTISEIILCHTCKHLVKPNHLCQPLRKNKRKIAPISKEALMLYLTSPKLKKYCTAVRNID